MSIYKMMNGTTGSYGYGDYTDYLPHGKRPGKWLPKQKPALCTSGYHYCRDLKQAIIHAGEALYEVEVKGEQVHGSDKSVAEQLRLVRRVPEWNEKTQRSFAMDCARLVVHLNLNSPGLQNDYLNVGIAYAKYGEASAAAKDTAWATACAVAKEAAGTTARDAARDTAWDAAWDAQAGLLARYLSGEEGPLVEESEA
jgi:hypothetical protein